MTASAVVSTPQLLGHGWVLDLLARSLLQQHAAHSYLIAGPPHVGKFTTAMAMAQLLLCEESRACGHCRQCRLASRREHPDLFFLEIPPDRKSIPLKDVHDFMHGMSLRPLEGTRKVYVIRGAEDLADEGANALLKTLEEPPPAVTLILTAPDPHQLLPTIVSRCQLITLRLVPPSEIAAYLVETRGVEATRADALARASQGRPGWAILASEDEDLFDERRQRAEDLLRLIGSGRLERLQYADTLAERWSGHADEVRDALEVWMEVWRDALLINGGLAERVRHVELAERIGAAARELGGVAVQTALAATLAVAEALERNANPRLALETHALLLPSLSRAR